MTEFEKILEECLLDLEQGASNVDECLSRYPAFSQQLKPVLRTHSSLERLGEARPSPAFKARVRARLTREMRAHPRKSAYFNFTFMRLAVNLAVIVVALLVAGTAYAQSTLPDDAFYAWKLASENAWRAVSSDPVGTDLAIADRRADELIAVSSDPPLRSQALEAYLEVTARLKSEMNAANEARILQTLDSQLEVLKESGILLPQIDQDVLPQFDQQPPTLVEPIMTLPSVTEIPQVNPTLLAPAVVSPLPTELPQVVNPTNLPKIVPTVQALPNIIPTIQVPKLLP